MAHRPPKVVGHGAEQMQLICFAELRSEQRHIAGDSLAGPGPREARGLAVCESDRGYYLFTCDTNWNVMFDSFGVTLEEVLKQAAFQYANIDALWVHPQTK